MNFIIRFVRFLYRKSGHNFLSNVRKAQQKKIPILTSAESNEYFKKIIDSESPSMLSRLGTPESNCLLNSIQVRSFQNVGVLKKLDALLRGNSNIWNHQVKVDLENLVGFFPTTDENLLNFSSIYSEKIKDIDGIGVWGFVPGENYIIKKYCPTAVAFDPYVLDPYFFEFPWTENLKGKKVLVVHPFAESISSQYKKRKLIFKSQKILPEFYLHTFKTVQTIAGNKTSFNSWFEALEYMKSEIEKIDFQVALIAAGSYGLPLASHIKKLGKCAIHMGGSLQILFGVKGKRWDSHPSTALLYNEHWVRPNEKEVVKNADIVEGGCYW